jgi:hypothetical protein
LSIRLCKLRRLLLELQEGVRWEILERVVGAELVIFVDVGHAIEGAAGPYIRGLAGQGPNTSR